ncbi:hypothetical protein CTI12_AA103110 [Artemisia annua]|uniref:Uncharacterized protein n=1 Tax=Artemisia annua TaxID=35608 RepID=A0A2U1PWX3_ARTAN|nr:hypothetical protein CTI12_AA103110 [Artemisia annua]
MASSSSNNNTLPTIGLDILCVLFQLIVVVIFVWQDVFLGLKEIQVVVFWFVQDHRCDDFFWIDGELYSDWYKHTMHRMYVSMSSQEREVFEDDAHSHQMEIALAVMEERVARMVDEIQAAKSNVASWRKMCGFMLF